MRLFTAKKIVAVLFVALLGVAASGVAHACPNSDAEAVEDGGE